MNRRNYEPPSETDVQSRLDYIEGEADRLMMGEMTPESFKRLCYLMGYTAKVVRIHLKTGER